MNYRYVQAESFEDLACGRVIYHKSGYPSFPVRLAGELYLRCLEMIDNASDKAVIYDPCCGGAYLLTVLGFLCRKHIAGIYASDISSEAVSLAESNLNLLTRQGMMNRKAQLENIYRSFEKTSHFDAIQSAGRLLDLLDTQESQVNRDVFLADILDKNALAHKKFKADIVFTDVPYGNLVSWSQSNPPAIDRLLDTITPVLKDNSIIMISSDKSQKITNRQYKRVKKLIAGKRKIELLRREKE